MNSPLHSAGSSEFEQTLAAHCAHYSTLLEAADGALRGRRQLGILRLLTLEHANLLTANRAALEIEDSSHVHVFARCFSDYLEMTDRYDLALELHGRLLEWALERQSTGVECWARLGLGQALYLSGSLASAETELEAGLNLARMLGDGGALRNALLRLGRCILVSGRLDEAQTLLEEARDLAVQKHDNYGEASAVSALATLHRNRGELETARSLYEHALTLTLNNGSPYALMRLLPQQGVCEFLCGNIDAARQLHHQSLEINTRVHDTQHGAAVHHNLGMMALQLGDLDSARGELGSCLCGYRDAGDRYGEASALVSLCDLELAADSPFAAAPHLIEAVELSGRLSSPGGDGPALTLRLARLQAAWGHLSEAAEALRWVEQRIADGSFMPQGDEVQWASALRDQLSAASCVTRAPDPAAEHEELQASVALLQRSLQRAAAEPAM